MGKLGGWRCSQNLPTAAQILLFFMESFSLLFWFHEGVLFSRNWYLQKSLQYSATELLKMLNLRHFTMNINNRGLVFFFSLDQTHPSWEQRRERKDNLPNKLKELLNTRRKFVLLFYLHITFFPAIETKSVFLKAKLNCRTSSL